MGVGLVNAIRKLKTGLNNKLGLGYIGPLAAIVLLLGVIACSGASASSGWQQGLGEDLEPVAARSGNLVQEVPIQGRLVFPHTEELTFGIGGEVGELLVQPGQQVTRGEVLARLDAVSRADLGRAVAAAEVNQDRAQKKLDDFQRSYDQQLAVARQARAKADVALDQAQEQLDDFQRDYNQRMARSARDRSDAEVALDTALDALDDFHLDYDQRLASARQTRADAEAKLDAARKKLAGFSRDYQQKVATARQARATAELALDTAQDKLDDYSLGYTQRLEKARQSRATAEVNLRTAENALAAFIVTPTRDPRDPDQVFDVDAMQRLQVAVDHAAAELKVAQEEEARLARGPNPLERQELETALELARAKLSVAEKDLAQLMNQPGQEDVRLRQENVAAHRAGLEAEEKALDAFKSAGADTMETVSQERRVAQARADLAVAEQNLAALVAGADPLELHQLEAAVQEAEADLVSAQDSLQRLEGGPDALKLQQLQAGVDLARTVLASAEADHSTLSEGPEPLKLALLEQDLSLAQEAVTKAEKDLADLADGPDSLELALLEAELSLARSSLAEAEENLEGSAIRAPFDGVVSVVNAEVDDTVSKTSSVVHVVDPTVVEIAGSVPATDINSVAVEDEATVTIESLPGRTLEGTVSSIAAQPRTDRGVVTYPVTIRVKLPGGLALPVALSAVSAVIIHEGEEAVIVPRSAVRGMFGQPAVLVLTDNAVQERPVVLGASDGYWVEVVRGLDQGEQVVMEQASRPAS